MGLLFNLGHTSCALFPVSLFFIIPLPLCWFLPFFNKIYISIQYTKSTWNAYMQQQHNKFQNCTNWNLKKKHKNIEEYCDAFLFTHIHSVFFFSSYYIFCVSATHINLISSECLLNALAPGAFFGWVSMEDDWPLRHSSFILYSFIVALSLLAGCCIFFFFAFRSFL